MKLTYRGTLESAQFRINIPQVFNVPNKFVDYWLPILGLSEMKVLLYLIRKIYGKTDFKHHINLAQIHNATGLKSDSIVRAIQTLESKKLICSHHIGEDNQVVYYEITEMLTKGDSEK